MDKYYIEPRGKKILHTTKRRKAKLDGHTWRRNCLLNHVIKGNTEVTRKRGSRCKQLLEGLKEKRGYWKLEGETLRSRSVDR